MSFVDDRCAIGAKPIIELVYTWIIEGPDRSYFVD